MSLTTDRNDPRLCKGGADETPVKQCEVYLVLSEEERAKGFVRPVRQTYVHVGELPTYPLRDLTEEEKARYQPFGYIKYEEYPEDHKSGACGRYWTADQLKRKGCNGTTTMNRALAETYARDPLFYGATYCSICQMHRPVAEFVWDGTNERVGS